ncbi:hypothetical protein FBQ99_20130 [Chloroflexi bacterium CFX2]|nr:MAG: hypothetical protein EDM79_11425 [Chloroflexota bacterium]MCE7859114.1 hypothetical protein [Chloroflexi bacterium CFX2]MDL1944644.1 hypothetical protein [Chloroflexi bacterium CFX2]
MSRLTTRVVLTLLLCIGVVVGVFMSVRAVSANVQKDALGMYVLGGGLVNPLVEQSAPEQESFQSIPKTYPKGEGGGRDCESEYHVNPEE